MKLDLLALVAHPDDAELGCGGTLVAHALRGYRVGVVDYTQGELGTRGDVPTRLAEAQAAAEIMGLAVRENLQFRDGFFENDEGHQLAVVHCLRRFQPEIVLTNATYDRHPDHGKGAALTTQAVFLSGLKKIETQWDGVLQAPWRPKKVYHIIQSRLLMPDFAVDVSHVWEKKMAAIRAYRSQFHTSDASAEGEQTFISTPDFMEFIEGRGREFGKNIGVQYAEGFTIGQPLGVSNLFDLVQ